NQPTAEHPVQLADRNQMTALLGAGDLREPCRTRYRPGPVRAMPTLRFGFKGLDQATPGTAARTPAIIGRALQLTTLADKLGSGFAHPNPHITRPGSHMCSDC